MRFFISILLAISPLAHAEVLGNSGSPAAPAASRGGEVTGKRPQNYQPPKQLNESLKSIVRSRIPMPIWIGQFCTFRVVRGPARAAENRSCILKDKALPIGTSCNCGQASGVVTNDKTKTAAD